MARVEKVEIRRIPGGFRSIVFVGGDDKRLHKESRELKLTGDSGEFRAALDDQVGEALKKHGG